MRRWAVGWTRREAGLNLRVVQGKKLVNGKDVGDLRIEWRVAGQWQPVTMAAVAMLVDFWFENENVLYPYPAEGGVYFLKYLNLAAREGWQTADEKLKREQQQKRTRELEPGGPIEPPSDGSDFDAGWLTLEARRAWGTGR